MNSTPLPDPLNEAPRAADEPGSATAAVAPAAARTAAAPAKNVKRTGSGKPGSSKKGDAPNEFAVLRITLFSLFSIAVVVGVLFAWTGYSSRYAQVTEGWHIGQTKLVEVTVVREDKDRLACASDVVIEGIHCGWHANGTTTFAQHTQDDPLVISPYNTVKNELFLAAGLWTSLAPLGPVPTERFTAACNYKIQGVLKSVSLRWQEKSGFDAVKQSVTVGSLSNCVIPK